MKNKTTLIAVCMTLAIALALGGSVIAQQRDTGSESPEVKVKKDNPCQMMADRMEKMKEERNELREDLQSEVQAMNQASGDSKVDAIAKVVNTLADQQQRVWEMHDKMGMNMAQHMSQCPMAKSGECPMMQKMQKREGSD